MARIITTQTRSKKTPVVPARRPVPLATKEPEKVGVTLETNVINSGHQLVRGALTNGWTQVGLFKWQPENWITPVQFSSGVYLKIDCIVSQANLYAHFRLVNVAGLVEIPGSLLSCEGTVGPHNKESAALSLVSGETYMVQADCLGSADDEAFAAVQARVVVRQSF